MWIIFFTLKLNISDLFSDSVNTSCVCVQFEWRVMCNFSIAGRVITSGTRQSLLQAMTERKQQRTVWWPTKQQARSQIRHCHSHTPFASALPSTSQSSTMRSSTPLIAPAGYYLRNTYLHVRYMCCMSHVFPWVFTKWYQEH